MGNKMGGDLHAAAEAVAAAFSVAVTWERSGNATFWASGPGGALVELRGESFAFSGGGDGAAAEESLAWMRGAMRDLATVRRACAPLLK